MLQIIQDAEQLLEMFCEDCRLRGMTEESIRRYRSSLRIFLTFLRREGTSIDRINVQALRGFLQHIKFERGAKHKTVENYFSAISAFYDYLVFEGLISMNIIRPFRRRYLSDTKMTMMILERRLLTVEEMVGS